MRKFYLLLLKFVRYIVLTPMGLLPVPVLAQLEPVAPPRGTATGQLENVILNLVNIALILVGILAAIILIYGGVQYIISRGDDGAVEKAKNTILYAVVGLIVIGIAAAIVNFVIRAIAAA